MTTTTTKMVQLCGMAKGPNDRRDEASYVWSAHVPQRVALRVARSIDELGSGVVDDVAALGFVLDRPLPDGYRIASGHGVHVYYASGAIRRA